MFTKRLSGSLLLLASVTACHSELVLESLNPPAPSENPTTTTICPSVSWAPDQGIALVHHGDELSLLRANGWLTKLDVHGTAPPGSSGHLSALTRGPIIVTVFNWQRGNEHGSELTWLTPDGEVLQRQSTQLVLTPYGLDSNGAVVVSPNEPEHRVRVYGSDGSVTVLPAGFRPYANTFNESIIQGSLTGTNGEYVQGWQNVKRGEFTSIKSLDPLTEPVPIAGRFVYLTHGKTTPWLIIESADGDYSLDTLSPTSDPSSIAIHGSADHEWLTVSEFDSTELYVVNATTKSVLAIEPHLADRELFNSPCSGPLPTVDRWGHALIATRGPDQGAIERIDPVSKQLSQLGFGLTDVDAMSVVERGGTYLIAGEHYGVDGCGEISWETAPEQSLLAGRSLQAVRPNIGRAMALPSKAHDPRLNTNGLCLAYRHDDQISLSDVSSGETVSLGTAGALLWLDP